MYRIFFTNYGYYYSVSFDTLATALEAAKGLGFQAAIMRGVGLDETLVASWGPIGGVTWYDRDEQAKARADEAANAWLLR